MTYSRATKVDFELDHIDYFSTGACPGCEACGSFDENDNESYDLANEPHFSWYSCELCDSTLGGSRHPAHGVLDGEIAHYDICTDCLLYLNGYDPKE